MATRKPFSGGGDRTADNQSFGGSGPLSASDQRKVAAETAVAKVQAEQAQRESAASAEQAKFAARSALPGAPKASYDYGTAPTVDRTGFEAYNPNTTLGGVNSYDYRGEALDPNANTARGSQSRLLGLLETAAQGKGPSAAQDQLRAGTDANINAALAMAASARGNKMSANRAAIGNAGMANQQQANQSAMLRAQEMQQAYAQMGQTAGQVRAGDTEIGLANMKKNLELAVEQGKISSAEAQLRYSTNANALVKEAEMRATRNIAMGNAAVSTRGQDIDLRGQDISSALGWYNAEAGNVWKGEEMAAAREANRIKGREVEGATNTAVIGAFGGMGAAAAGKP